MENFGTLYVVSAPSGAGKTSLIRALVAKDAKVLVSVSHTTRLPRPGEQNGVHYHFINESVFGDMREKGTFLEYAKVFGNYYGTSREWVEEKIGAGLDVILEIDWQGARQIRKQISSCVGIFILPPSLDALVSRLHERRQDNHSVIANRMQEAKSELAHFGEFDYLVVNNNFDVALADLCAILRAERLARMRQERRHRSL